MKIKVLKNIKAASCPLGIKIKEYLPNETYEIFEELANVFIKEGWGKEVEKTKPVNDKLEALKEKAKELKIKGSHLMKTEETLLKAIEEKEAEKLQAEKLQAEKLQAEKLQAEKEAEKEAEKKALPKLENKAIDNLNNK